MKTYAIILASGTGSRFGSDIPKQFLKINDKTILEYSIEAFENSAEIDNIIVVITPQYKTLALDIIGQNNYKKITKILDGGKTRKDSSFIGVSAINDTQAKVLIHDCARPFISSKAITDCVISLDEYDAVCTAIPSSDTILETQDGIIKNIPERSRLMRAQTPQGFKLSVIKKAHELSKNDASFTDDCGLIAKYNLCTIKIITGSEENIKITYAKDLLYGEKILKNHK